MLVPLQVSKYTPPKFHMEPKNEGLEDVFPFQMDDFQVPAVSFPGFVSGIFAGCKKGIFKHHSVDLGTKELV